MGTNRSRSAVAALALCTPLSWTGSAVASERQLHVGPDFGFALAAFPDATVSGFGGGVHVSYGITDVFNLRVHGAVTVFDLPLPATSALIYNTAAGAEMVLDILQWVPYAGVMVGPSTLSIQDGDTVVQLGVEFPLGVGYQLSSSWTVGIEARYQLLFLGEAASPTSNLAAFGRIEHVWGF